MLFSKQAQRALRFFKMAERFFGESPNKPKRRSMPRHLKPGQPDSIDLSSLPPGIQEVLDATKETPPLRGAIEVRGRNVGSDYRF